jgi:hypothetical protein
VRPAEGAHTGKPGTKLYNAWLAGVPAVLGPEPAFRELRRHELDYLEVTSVEEALAAIDRLRSDPALYRAMVDHGRERARDFSVEAILDRWTDLLWERVPALAAQRPLRSVPPLLRPAVRKVSGLLQRRSAR